MPLVAAAPLLRFMWTATLLLVLVALVVVLVLVLRRMVEELRAERQARDRKAVHHYLMRAALGQDRGPPPTALTRLDRAEIAELVSELASVVRGEMRRRLAAAAMALGVLEHELARSRSRRAALRARSARRLPLFATVAAGRVGAALARLLEDPVAEVRVAAATAAIEVDAALRTRACQQARHDPAFARRLALRFWERLGELEPATLARLARDDDPERLRLILEAAGRGRLLALAREAVAALDHPYLPLRLAAVGALVEMDHPRGLAALKQLVEATDPVLRLAAFTLMRQDPRPAFTPLAVSRLDDPDLRVAFRARELLVRLDPERARELGVMPREQAA